MSSVVKLTRKNLKRIDEATGPPRNPSSTQTEDTPTSIKFRRHDEVLQEIFDDRGPKVDYDNLVIITRTEKAFATKDERSTELPHPNQRQNKPAVERIDPRQPQPNTQSITLSCKRPMSSRTRAQPAKRAPKLERQEQKSRPQRNEPKENAKTKPGPAKKRLQPTRTCNTVEGKTVAESKEKAKTKPIPAKKRLQPPRNCNTVEGKTIAQSMEEVETKPGPAKKRTTVKGKTIAQPTRQLPDQKEQQQGKATSRKRAATGAGPTSSRTQARLEGHSPKRHIDEQKPNPRHSEHKEKPRNRSKATERKPQLRKRSNTSKVKTTAPPMQQPSLRIESPQVQTTSKKRKAPDPTPESRRSKRRTN